MASLKNEQTYICFFNIDIYMASGIKLSFVHGLSWPISSIMVCYDQVLCLLTPAEWSRSVSAIIFCTTTLFLFALDDIGTLCVVIGRREIVFLSRIYHSWFAKNFQISAQNVNFIIFFISLC